MGRTDDSVRPIHCHPAAHGAACEVIEETASSHRGLSTPAGPPHRVERRWQGGFQATLVRRCCQGSVRLSSSRYGLSIW